MGRIATYEVKDQASELIEHIDFDCFFLAMGKKVTIGGMGWEIVVIDVKNRTVYVKPLGSTLIEGEWRDAPLSIKEAR